MPSISYRSINLSITIEECVPGRPSRAKTHTSAARSTVAKFVTVWSIPFISGSDETKGVAHGWKLLGWLEATLGLGIVQLPRLHLTEGPQIYHRRPLYPHQISSRRRRRSHVPSYVILALRQLIYLWADISSLRVLLFPFPSTRPHFVRTRLEPPRQEQSDFTYERNVGRTRPNFFLATLRKKWCRYKHA